VLAWQVRTPALQQDGNGFDPVGFPDNFNYFPCLPFHTRLLVNRCLLFVAGQFPHLQKPVQGIIRVMIYNSSLIRRVLFIVQRMTGNYFIYG
jgi:hypothetical protein